MTGLAGIEEAVAAIGRGEIVVVVDDEDRENEGDLIMAAEFATPEKIAFFLQHTSGVICATVTSERAREVTGPRRGLDERLDRQRAVAGGDARRGAVPVVDGVCERRAVRLGVVLDHEGQPELVASLAGQRHADDP